MRSSRLHQTSTDNTFGEAVALHNTIAFLKKACNEFPDIPIEVREILKMYNGILKEEGLPAHDEHVSRFGEMMLQHCNDFEIHKNSKNVNVFTLKNKYVKTTSGDLQMNAFELLRRAKKNNKSYSKCN